MAHILLPRRWQQQPAGALDLNPHHWLANDLLFVYPGGPPGTPALVRGAPVPPRVDTAARLLGLQSGSPFESAGVLTGNSSGYLLFDAGPIGPWDLSLIAWFSGNAYAGDIDLLSVGSAATPASQSLRFTNADDVGAVTTNSSGTTRTASGTININDDVWHQMCAVFRADTTRGGYTDGANGHTSTTTWSTSTDLDTVGLCGRVSAGAIVAGMPPDVVGLALPMIVGRVLSANEIAALYREQLDNPWQIFRARGRVLYFDVGGGGGQTITHNLSGSAVSALASTLSAEIDVAINGVSVTTSTGTLSPAIEVTSSGSAVSVLSGSISPSLEVAISGESVATSAGTVSSGSDTVLALSGSQATSSVGPLSIAVDVALSGQSISAETGIVGSGSDTTQALSGSSVATQSGTLAQDTDLALSGSVVEVSAGIISGIEGVERTLTGSAVTSNAGNVSESIEIALTGQNVTTESGFIGAGADVTKALTGSQVTVAQQTLYSDIAVTAVGAASTVVVGSIFGNSEVGLLGIELTPTLGAFVPNITCSINGSQAITYTGILTGYDVLNIVRNVVARNAYVSSKVSKTSILSFKVSKGVLLSFKVSKGVQV